MLIVALLIYAGYAALMLYAHRDKDCGRTSTTMEIGDLVVVGPVGQKATWKRQEAIKFAFEQLEGQITLLMAAAIAIVAGIGYLWLSKSQGSPYVHWSSVVTDLPLQQCEALTREAYRLTGIVETENPVMDESSVGQVGIAEPVTSVIVCVRTGEKTTVMVIASGPDQTITQNRQAQLRDVVQNELPGC